MDNKVERIKLLFLISFVTVAVWFMSINQWFNYLSGHVYDLYVEANFFEDSAKKTDGELLLVELDPSGVLTEQDWRAMLNNLFYYKPKLLIVNHFPQSLSKQFFADFEQKDRLLFLQYFSENKKKYIDKQYVLQTLPFSAESIKINAIPAQIPRSETGVFRHSEYALKTIDSWIPLFELSVLNKLNGLNIESYLANESSTSFLINYLAGQGELPRISSGQILDDNLIEELVKNKIILIGQAVNEMGYSFFTPISENYPTSLLELQGYSLATLLEEKKITEFTPLHLAILILVQSFFSLIIYQWGSRSFSFNITVGIITITLFLTWWLLFFWLIWFPIFEFILIQLLIYYLTFRYKAIIDEDVLQKALLNVTSRTQERVIPADFYQLDEPWSEVINLVNQTLNLNRLIFLERIEDDHRLREVKALNCSINDIHEMRRDYERHPYSTAIEQKGPILIDTEKRRYLVESNESEIQYLVPLAFADDVLGFWAFGVQPEYIAYNSHFETVVKDYASQIAELLFYRQRFQKILQENHSLARYIGLNNESTSQHLLRQTIELLNKRLDSHESVFRGMKTATILYDLFGRVMQINQNMEKFTQNIGVSPYEMTALEFVKHLTEMELSSVRTIMQHIIIERKSYNIPLQNDRRKNRYMVLNIKPLKSYESKGSEDFEGVDLAPFQVKGILLEMNDLTEVKDELTAREKMNEHFFFQIRNDMEPLLMGVNMLKNQDVPIEDKYSIIDLLHEKISHTAETTKNLHSYYYQDNNFLAANKFPIEPVALLKQVIESERIQEAENKVDIDWDDSLLESLVYAEPHQLKALFTSVIILLFSDTIEGGKVYIFILEHKKFMEFNFTNEGFGMPDEQFQTLLNDSSSSSSEYLKISNLTKQLAFWDGEAEAKSAIGKGMSFNLKFEKVFM